jgi:hypothetical protein
MMVPYREGASIFYEYKTHCEQLYLHSPIRLHYVVLSLKKAQGQFIYSLHVALNKMSPTLVPQLHSGLFLISLLITFLIR